MTSEAVLKQVRDRLGPLDAQAEQAVAEAVEIIRQMNESSLSTISEDSFKGENASLQEYLSWSDDQQEQYQSDAENLNAKWIEKNFRELNAMWMIVIEGKIIGHGPLLRTFPHDEEFDALCKKYGKYPFVFHSPRLFYIEENVAWHPTKSSNDSYPALRIKLKEGVDEAELEADFDTGALDTYVDSDLLMQQGAITIRKEDPKKKSSHLGQPFSYLTKFIWIELQDKNGQRRQINTIAILVKNWNNSPFIAINPNRTALVGRDTMLQLKPKISLDFAARQTEVEYLTATS
jgi:hypothetical protein